MSETVNLMVLPSMLLNPVYVAGLAEPLNATADLLDEQHHPEFALAMRNAATICKAFADVNLSKTATLFSP